MFKKYSPSKQERAREAHCAQRLNLEQLEDRTMLSSVQIFAQGETGDENMQLLINDQVVASWENIDTTTSSYFYQTEETIEPRDIKIEFTNDEYRPADGYDRNLTVYSVEVDDASLSTGEPSTFSTGVYVEGRGIVPGFWESSTLHANGYFSFLQELQFAGETWETTGTGNFDINQSGSLVITNGTSEVSISRQLENFSSSATYSLNIDIDRPAEIGFRYATVGINFYDFNGNLIDSGSQFNRLALEANQESNVEQFRFSPPDSATTAFLWLWVNGDQPVASPVIVNQIEVVQIQDSVAPVLNQPLSLRVVPEFTDGTFEFFVTFRDINLSENGISPDAFTMVRSDGLELSPYFFETSSFGLEFKNAEVKFAPEGGWRPEFNGEWSVRVNANSVVDEAGNAFPESFVKMQRPTLAANNISESLFIEILDASTDTLGPRAEFLTGFISNFSASGQSFVRWSDPNGVNSGWIDAQDFYLIDPDGNVFTPNSPVFSSVGDGTGDNRFVTNTISWNLTSPRAEGDTRPWTIGVNAGGVADFNGDTNEGGVIASFNPETGELV